VTPSDAALGITVKSGWAAVVLLAGSPTSPRVVDSSRIDLSDPALPESRQPYHLGFGTARESGPELAKLLRSVRHFGRRSLTALIRGYHVAGHHLGGAGLVVGSTIDPATIGNDHIRIHALEGQLFRRVVEHTVARRGVPYEVWRSRDLYGAAARVLGRPEQRLRRTLADLGSPVAGPWRVEHKEAALAAWLVLAESGGETPTVRRRA
jgi:hypothetical protein